MEKKDLECLEGGCPMYLEKKVSNPITSWTENGCEFRRFQEHRDGNWYACGYKLLKSFFKRREDGDQEERTG
jgi:hypothetical protein